MGKVEALLWNRITGERRAEWDALPRSGNRVVGLRGLGKTPYRDLQGGGRGLLVRWHAFFNGQLLSDLLVAVAGRPERGLAFCWERP